MQVAGYSLSMQAGSSQSQQSSVAESLRVQVRQASLPPSPAQSVTLSSAGQNLAAMDQGASCITSDPNLQVLVLLLERMTGHAIQVFDPGQLTPIATPQLVDPNAVTPSASAGYGINYSQTSSYSESQQSTMQASGVINTSDGQQIKFSLNISMQYQYSQSSSVHIKAGNATLCDPLVINFNGTGAELSDQKFSFDLNSTGQKVSINMPGHGTGFLVLDKSNTGKITSGSQLFGPSTGDGFAELAKYDANQNGWIDQADPAFNQIKVWSKNADGSDQLQSLSSLGIGAIALQSIATPFDIKNATDKLLGKVISSGVAVNENGTADSVQQVDLAV